MAAGAAAVNAAVCGVYDVGAVDATNAGLVAALDAIERVVIGGDLNHKHNHGVANASCIYDLIRPQPAEDKRRLGAAAR